MGQKIDFLQGAIDIHIHCGPDYVKRYATATQLAQEAKAAGMRAIIIKGHLHSTVAAAAEAEAAVGGVQVFGGIAMNEPTGTLNPRTVEAAARSGGKMVWLPTVDALYAINKAQEGHWIRHYVDTSVFGYEREGIEILEADGSLKRNARLIADICKHHGIILGTGHVSPKESLQLARYAKEIGYTQLEVTHPNAWLEDFTPEVLHELASLGAKMSLSYGACSTHNGSQKISEIRDVIKDVGAEHCILMTDYGQTYNPPPAEGLNEYCNLLHEEGITEDEINRMIKTNPAALLGI